MRSLIASRWKFTCQKKQIAQKLKKQCLFLNFNIFERHFFCTRRWDKVQNVTLTWAPLCAFVKMPGPALRKYPPHTPVSITFITDVLHSHSSRIERPLVVIHSARSQLGWSMWCVLCVLCVCRVWVRAGALKSPRRSFTAHWAAEGTHHWLLTGFTLTLNDFFFSLSLTRKFHSLQLFNRRLPSWVGPGFTHSTSFILYQRSHFDWTERDVNHPRLTLQRIVPPSNFRLNFRRSV